MNFPQALVAALFFVPGVLSQSLEVNTPTSVVGCEPVQLAWSGGTPPYYLSLVPAGQTGATPLKQFPSQNGNTYTWLADLAAGTSFTITLRDGEGIQAFSDKVAVQSGPDTSCSNDQSSSGDDGTTEGSAQTTAAGITSGSVATGVTSSSVQPIAPGAAKITSNGNAQPTVSSAQPSSPHATTKQSNASYQVIGNELQKILASLAVAFFAFNL